MGMFSSDNDGYPIPCYSCEHHEKSIKELVQLLDETATKIVHQTPLTPVARAILLSPINEALVKYRRYLPNAKK